MNFLKPVLHGSYKSFVQLIELNLLDNLAFHPRSNLYYNFHIRRGKKFVDKIPTRNRDRKEFFPLRRGAGRGVEWGRGRGRGICPPSQPGVLHPYPQYDFVVDRRGAVRSPITAHWRYLPHCQSPLA